MGINITINPESCLWAGGRPGRSVVIVNEFGRDSHYRRCVVYRAWQIEQATGLPDQWFLNQIWNTFGTQRNFKWQSEIQQFGFGEPQGPTKGHWTTLLFLSWCHTILELVPPDSQAISFVRKWYFLSSNTWMHDKSCHILSKVRIAM